MDNYEMIDNEYYPNDYYYEDSRTLAKTFLSAATIPSVQTTYFSKLLDSKNK
ncbi:20928_t:CDS:1, partial [Gigaspora margarita]